MCLALLHIGGLVAVGFDPTGRYLLTVSHSGRGVFDTSSWQRVARDASLAYPEDGVVEGIGPIAGQRLKASEIDYDNGTLSVISPRGDFSLFYEEGTLTVHSIPAERSA
jgi:hypothetical protein